MPEESKKNQSKSKNEPRDQRKRGGRKERHPAGPVEKKPEKQPEVPKEPEKPAFEPPGPEFYKSLKRETDEILKITEEASTKYKKKEIKSNWAKYEMPVESYEEIDDQENLGADYEKLIQMPASTGGHFQFKHEKSWDTTTGSSLYDKYFDIDMDHLTLALNTIPFYERNNLETSIFNENDLVTMKHRATKFKQKYFNDKNYSTPDIESNDRILKALRSHNDEKPVEGSNDVDASINIEKSVGCEKSLNIEDNKITEIQMEPNVSSPLNLNSKTKELDCINFESKTKELDEINFGSRLTNNKPIDLIEDLQDDIILLKEKEDKKDDKIEELKITEALTTVESPKQVEAVKSKEKVTIVAATPKNPVIESPEDLEKWLDDFLDGLIF